ncbi:YaiI/YqxD family protein [Alkaliphilus hydrothermalis]|uniref:UPF0178 protein JOC73_001143 n=1 Tax=Alkaliphilus hydrothermalis TaxID=1482730 RepID=A0ABS2NP43_9FIRM|nr:YaiI/YqxD family protein [Alkaliphilus hydrothermalis]MBM7614631.1 uncharacterized protein YaiI (UPF0178 family) [Alkaliphilus hydrothermalis]
MRMIVDADACPVKEIIAGLCAKYGIKLIFIHSLDHISSQYNDVEKIIVDKGFQSADMAIVNNAQRGDLVITADIGLAAMVIGRGAFVLNPWGGFYTPENIDQHLHQRYLNQKILSAKGRLKGPSKRNKEDDKKFAGILEDFLNKSEKN